MAPSYVFPAPLHPALPIVGTDALFPVRRIFCIGRNYAAHAREMGGDPTREPPFFFQKAADTIQICQPGTIVDHPYPPMTSNYHFEAEMVVALHKGGRDIKEIDALAHVFGYAVGLDMTRRDRQDEAKAQKRPWEIAKSADLSAPVGPLYPVSSIGHPHKGAIKLNVNGIVKQDADLNAMIWSVSEQISILSTYFELKPGDLIFSGTPEGVSAVTRGDHMNVAIAGLGRIDLRVV